MPTIDAIQQRAQLVSGVLTAARTPCSPAAFQESHGARGSEARPGNLFRAVRLTTMQEEENEDI